MNKLVLTVIGLLLITGCSTQSEESSYTPMFDEPSSTLDETNGDESVPVNPKVDSDYPSEWSSTEKEIFTLFVGIYPSSEIMSLYGKRALMDNSYLICEAFGDGYSRREIQAATSGGAFTAEMADDWMALSVTYLCPQYFDLQMGD